METNQTITKSETSERIFIDRFIVPQTAKPEFLERMKINRNLLKTLPGFIGDAIYDRTDEQGNMDCVTTAIWANDDAVKNAKQAVQALYQKENFDMPGMLKRLNIVIDRGLYKKMENPNVKTQVNAGSNKSNESTQVLIDKVTVPHNANQEFIDRMTINRNFIKTLPGFIHDEVYERTDDSGNTVVMTVAVWKSGDAIKNAFSEVQALYQKEGFDMKSMLQRLNITMERRGIYKPSVN